MRWLWASSWACLAGASCQVRSAGAKATLQRVANTKTKAPRLSKLRSRALRWCQAFRQAVCQLLGVVPNVSLGALLGPERGPALDEASCMPGVLAAVVAAVFIAGLRWRVC